MRRIQASAGAAPSGAAGTAVGTAIVVIRIAGAAPGVGVAPVAVGLVVVSDQAGASVITFVRVG